MKRFVLYNTFGLWLPMIAMDWAIIGKANVILLICISSLSIGVANIVGFFEYKSRWARR